jgi:hypothetical protein
VLDDVNLECQQGFCDVPPDGVAGICRAAQSSGPCKQDRACVAPTECFSLDPEGSSTCQLRPAERATGAPCTTNDPATPCGRLGYCRPNAPQAEPEARMPGACRAFKKVGEACVAGQDRCTYYAACISGVCTSC